MDLDILFLGKFFPKEKEAEIKSKMKRGMQEAGNALQLNIIDGLDANNCGTVKLLDYLPIDSYPKGYEDREIKEYVFHHTDKYKTEDKIVGCTNLTVIKQFCNLQPFLVEVKAWACDGGNRQKVLLMYTASTIFLQLAKYVKQHHSDIITCCIIADLPEFISAQTLHGIRKVFNDYETRKANSLYRYIDKYVLLTNQMAERLNISAPYTVMEGIAPADSVEVDESIAQRFKNEKYILYTGTLNYEFGIGTLLEAFALIPDNDLKLVICGFGEAEKAILEAKDSRLIYLGKVDRKQALALQRNATVLVNPRQNNQEFTKYSFPSKTMEYLASGVPVVAYKLDGIPDEYDEYLHYVPDNSPEALAEVMSELLQKPENIRKELGRKAQRFVLEEKNYIAQTKRILELLSQ